MSPELIIGAMGSALLALIGIVYNNLSATDKSQWSAMDRKASAETLREVREQFAHLIEQNRQDFNSRLADLASRQDREVDALKAEMSRVTESLSELRRDVTQNHTNLMERLQEMTLMMRTPRQ